MRKEYYEQHKQEILEKAKKYREEHKKERSEYQKRYYQEHKEDLIDYQTNYRNEHRVEKNQKQIEYSSTKREELALWQREYRKTKDGRAKTLILRYKQNDNEYGRGECTLTAEQLINLWENGCYWCGEKDWHKLGADRIDNTKAHTLENCVCACKSCNDKRGNLSFDEFKKLNN